MSRKRVLFVDDDTLVLNGLRTVFRRERARWDMVFVSSAAEALAEFRREPFDVIVSDMRMPAVDGATLLNQIKTEFPATARILLSGFAEPDAIARALPALHQLLAKPLHGAALRSTIERTLDATSGSLAHLGSIDRLPTPTAVLAQLAESLRSPCLDEATLIVASDPGLSAKVLQLVASPHIAVDATPGPISIHRAMAILGLERLDYLRTHTSIFHPVANEEPWLELMRQRTVRGAHVAQNLCDGDGELAYTCALLRDAGRLVLASDDEPYRDAVIFGAGEKDLIALERIRYGGITHAELGAWLLSLWGLPVDVTDVVRFHTRPDAAPEPSRELACIVHAADAIADEDLESLDREAIVRAGFGDALERYLPAASASRASPSR